MMQSSRRRIAIGMVVLGALAGLAIDAWRSEETSDRLRFVRRPSNVQTRDDAALLSGLLEEVDNGWEVGKNHQRVRSVFRTVVADARQSTVRVFADGEQIAMGTIVDPNGYIVTKASELDNKGKLSCQLYDRRKFRARITSRLLEHDLAMLKISATRLVPARWSETPAPPVGSLLATPHLGREPLAVGVVSLGTHRVANNGVLGITLRDAAHGPSVREVIPGSAADAAGIEVGDLVLTVNQRRVATSGELVDAISLQLPGDLVDLNVQRRGEELTMRAELGRRADLDPENVNFQGFLGGELSFRRSGFPNVLQHDTFLLPKHCGGPLVDLDGRVVGINIARAERIASYAVPARDIMPWLQSLDLVASRSSDSRTQPTAQANSSSAKPVLP